MIRNKYLVHRKDVFGIIVFYQFEYGELLIKFFLICNRNCHLNISDLSIVALCDKIDFSVFDAASGYLISAPLQFKINHILNKLLQFKRRVVQDVIFKSEVS